MLTIFKASAGSGKTYRLVLEYLMLVMKNPYLFRQILAVTFTNKATAEMKNRILEQLYNLARGYKSSYLQELTQNLNLPEKQIRENAEEVLENILHEYQRFSVSTIDSFTQKIIRAFNRELGISPAFTLEIDNEMILEEAIDRLLENIGDNKNLLHWLLDFSEEKITENKNHLIEKDIFRLGNELFREKFQLFFPATGNSVYTRENLDLLRNELNKITGSFKKELKSKALQVLEHINQSGFSIDDFAYKLTGIAGYFKNLSEEKIKEPGSRVLEAEQDSGKWINKNHKKREELLRLTENRLMPLLAEILAIYRKSSRQYFTAISVNAQLRILGILTDLKEEVKKLLHENGALQLSDANLLLRRIIGESDSPFIYEKTGSRFSHFMLDEFQDTSTMQWMNFKPLISNSLSEGKTNLVVGDVKQSIYRWRNSDWNILAHQVEYDFPNRPPQKVILTENWRSDKHIIEFNNAVVKNMVNIIEEIFFQNGDGDILEKERKKFSAIYDDIEQKQGNPGSNNKGWVKVRFFPEEDFREKSAEMLVEEVKSLQDRGLKASEIAILIRKNKEGTVIVREFLNAAANQKNSAWNLSVLSNESLFLESSKAVRFVIHVAELLVDPDNVLVKAALLNLWNGGLKSGLDDMNANTELNNNYQQLFYQELETRVSEVRKKIILSSPEETITKICAEFGLFSMENELPFLQALIDWAAEIRMNTANDLSNFLMWWKEKGCNISVSINEETDAIRLLTVHKSKGLEFKAVLIPFLDWNTTWAGSQAPILWCATEKTPFSRFPVLPVKGGEILKNTWFENEYLEEKSSAITDTMNLIYVAFTRAKSFLIIHTKDNREKDKKNVAKNADFLLGEALLKMSAAPPFENCWNEDQTVFESGIPGNSTSEFPKAQDQVLITHYHYQPFDEKVRLKTSGEKYLSSEDGQRSRKDTGNIIHEILSGIQKKSDLERACLKPFFEGRITEKELEEIMNTVKKILDHPETSCWFDGSWKVLNERNLLAAGHILRPDRIMTSGNRAIVVDYKTGGVKSDSHIKQVRKYAETLKDSGFEKINGYVWYISLNEIISAGHWEMHS